MCVCVCVCVCETALPPYFFLISLLFSGVFLPLPVIDRGFAPKAVAALACHPTDYSKVWTNEEEGREK